MRTTASGKRMGRPPLPPEEAKTKAIRIVLTPAEHAAIKELSRRLNRPAGEIMRTDALNRAAAAGIPIAAAAGRATSHTEKKGVGGH